MGKDDGFHRFLGLCADQGLEFFAPDIGFQRVNHHDGMLCLNHYGIAVPHSPHMVDSRSSLGNFLNQGFICKLLQQLFAIGAEHGVPRFSGDVLYRCTRID